VIEVDDSGRMTLVALAGESGVRLNGEWVDESLVREGDRVQIGSTEIVIEEVVLAAAELTAPGRVTPSVPTEEPLLAFAGEAYATSIPLREAASYALVSSGPAVRSDDVEVAHQLVAEVRVSWGDNVLFVTHLDPDQSFHVGDEQKPHARCDFLVPREKLGASRLPLVLGDSTSSWLVIPAHAEGYIESIDGSRSPLELARARAQPCAEVPHARKLLLSLGLRARLEFGDIVFDVALVRAGKPMPHGLVAGWDASVLAYLGLSALSVGGLLSSMALLVPPLGILADDETDPDRLYLLQQYLSSAAERQQRTEPGESAQAASAAPATGAQAMGAEGGMGKPEETRESGRFGVQGRAERDERRLSRHDTPREAEFQGIIGLLDAGAAGDPNAPTAPWGADLPNGSDEISAQGQMWGEDIGSARGPGGLGLSGPGSGGGKRSEGIGLGPIGTLGPMGGLDDGIGAYRAPATGSHRTAVPRLREANATVSGRLPAEVVRRIVRRNHPRFRHCYEKGLLTNPSLEGRVSVRFVIGRDGAVTHVADAGSDLPDPGVVRCVSNAFYDIGFPKPEGGIVSVVYPIALQAD
jgi:hypothetical protein